MIFFQCFVALFAVLASAAAAPQYGVPAPVPVVAPAPIVAPAPAYGPAPVPVPAYGPAPVYPDVPPAYDYTYGVNDGYSGANFGASESRNGYATQGEYHVALPDGRLQTVTYTADANTGYIADVKYTGEAVYAPAPAPAYGPAPVVAAAPIPAPVVVPAPAPYRPAPVVVPAPAPYRPAPVVVPAPAPYGPGAIAAPILA